MEENFSCKICFERFNSSRNKPRLLITCGHTFCQDCLSRLTRRECPVCKAAYVKSLVVWDLIPPEGSTSTDNTDPEQPVLNVAEFRSELNYTSGLIKFNCGLTKDQLDHAERTVRAETEKLVSRILGEENLILERIKRGRNTLKSLENLTRLKMLGLESSYEAIRTQARRSANSSGTAKRKTELQQLNQLIERDMNKLRRLNEPLEKFTPSYAFQPMHRSADERILGQVNEEYFNSLDKRYNHILRHEKPITLVRPAVPSLPNPVQPVTSSRRAPETESRQSGQTTSTRKVLVALRRVNQEHRQAIRTLEVEQ